MGLSSSSSKTTTNQNQQTNQTENATTTPVTPDWLTGAAQDYVSRIGDFGSMDPNSFVAPSSPLQNMAWQNAGSLGDWRQQTATASQLANAAGNAAPNYAGLSPAAQDALGGDHMTAMHSSAMPAPQNAFSGASSQQGPAYTYQAPQVAAPPNPTAYGAQPTSLGPAPQSTAASYQAPTLGAAPQASVSGYGAPQLGAPNLVSGAGYTAPQLGNAQGYAAARVGAPIGATAATYQAPTVSPTNGATASSADPASLLTNLSSYQNPYTQNVVNASLADYDQNTGQMLAANTAAAARNGALGGSRYAIEDAALQSNQARGRAQLESSLLNQGFNEAAGLATSDAANRQATGLFNAQNSTANSQFNASQDSARSQLNATLAAQAASQNANALTGTSQFNSGQDLQGRLAQAGLDTDASHYGADIGNQFRTQQAGLDAASGQYNASNAQQAALSNQNAWNTVGLANAGYAQNAGQFLAGAANTAALANQSLAGQYGLTGAQLAAQAGMYNAGNQQQTALANQSLAGQYGLADFGANTQNAQNYAAALNAAGITGYQGQLSSSQLGAQLGAQAGQYNAGANNQMTQFNASQGDAALNRQLQAAGMLGGLANDYGAGTRADLATMGQLGDQQRGVEQAYAMAGPAQLQLMGQLSGMTPYDILVGRNVSGTTNGTMTGTGTSTTSQTPSLFSSLLQGAQVASAFF